MLGGGGGRRRVVSAGSSRWPRPRHTGNDFLLIQICCVPLEFSERRVASTQPYDQPSVRSPPPFNPRESSLKASTRACTSFYSSCFLEAGTGERGEAGKMVCSAPARFTVGSGASRLALLCTIEVRERESEKERETRLLLTQSRCSTARPSFSVSVHTSPRHQGTSYVVCSPHLPPQPPPPSLPPLPEPLRPEPILRNDPPRP